MRSRTVHERRWWILGVLSLCLLVIIADNTILNVALKTIQTDLDASQASLQWAVDAYIVVFAGLLFTFGVLGDRLGRRRLLIGGLVVFGAASAMAAWSNDIGQLIGLRALMGVGAAASQPATLAIITNVFSPEERGRAIGVWAGVSGLSIAIGPLAGGFLLEHFWWGSAFLVNVPIVVVAVALIVWLVPESRDPRPHRIDPVGVVLSIVGLSTLVYGIIKGGQEGDWLRWDVVGLIAAGIAVLAAFVLMERRRAHPALDVSLFRNPAFSAATAAIGLQFFALSGATFFLAFYLQVVVELSPLQTGAALVPVAVGILLTAPRSSTLVRRYGAKLVCAIGLLLAGGLFGAFAFVDADTPLWIIEVLLFVQGVGMGNVMAPATESIMSAVPRDKAGAGSAVNNTVRQVGGALGVAILGSILASSYREQISPSLGLLPAGVRDQAGESIGNTLAAAQAVGGRAMAIADPARDAFVSAMHVTTLVTAMASLLAVVVVVLWLPGRRPAAVREVSEPEPPRVPEEVG